MSTYLFNYLLAYSMEQSPSWEANRFSDSQEIPRIFWKPKFHYSHNLVPVTKVWRVLSFRMD
jgi:hypothetical protein